MKQTVPILHSDSDNLSAIRMDDYYDSCYLIAAYLAYLDGKLDYQAEGHGKWAWLYLEPARISMKPSGTFRLLSCDDPFSMEELCPQNQF